MPSIKTELIYNLYRVAIKRLRCWLRHRLLNVLSMYACVVSSLLTFICILFPVASHATVLTADTVWQGEVRVTEDILVPEGVTLIVRPGTVVTVVASESTRTEPEYVSPLTEITVRGKLVVEGGDKALVEFSGEGKKAGSWGGIIVDNGSVALQGCRIRHAEAALTLLGGELKGSGTTLQENRYGLVVYGKDASARLDASKISENDYGVFLLQGGVAETGSSLVAGNRKRDSYRGSAREYKGEPLAYAKVTLEVARRYQDIVLRGETVWQGRIEVDGVIRVPEGSRLVIMPGTVVEFLRKDTNGDGIGENGFLVQGRLIAKGTKDSPIIFRSAEKMKRPGDWDSINIMNSSGPQNLLEYCLIEDAYRALHFHFSNVALQNSILRNNYRGVQFQESLVDIKGNRICDNKSGIQGRDSDITLTNNLICNNTLGANFFRANLVARGNRIVNSWREGLRVREGVASLQENLIDGNRYGLLIADIYFGDYSSNAITNNLEVGVSIRNADNLEFAGNAVVHNGLSGVTLQDVNGLIKGNQITDNGERGVGVLSYAGTLTENNLGNNGLYALDLDGTMDVSASANWWGADDPAKVIFDKRIDKTKGEVSFDRPSRKPFTFAWPLKEIITDTIWRGSISIGQRVTVIPGALLQVMPGTTVTFAHATGLTVKGRIVAKGRSGEEIIFTSAAKKGASEWDELLLEYATGSEIAHAIFEHANWALHSHFTNLSVTDCYFRHNYGGMRFRSGPVIIARSLFSDNAIAIRSYIGKALIKENLITGNDVGIFVREKGSGLNISGNNIYENRNYNVRVGDFNDEDIAASGNWWGGGDPLQTIFDGRNEPGIGKVLIEPYLKEPVKSSLRLRP